MARSAALGANEIGLQVAESEAGDDEYGDEQELERRPGVVVGAAKPHAAQMHERGEPGYGDPEQQCQFIGSPNSRGGKFGTTDLK